MRFPKYLRRGQDLLVLGERFTQVNAGLITGFITALQVMA